MERPTITIEGKTYEMPKPKCGMWRKLILFDKENNDVFTEDFIEKRCEFLGEIYGVSADLLLDNLYLEEVMTLYRETMSYIIGQLSGKLAEVTKNVSEGDKTE